MTAINPLNNAKLQSNLDASSNKVVNVVDPSSDQDVSTKKYVDDNVFSGDHADLSNVTSDQHHSESHTIASHSDTSATGSELNTLTDNSIANALHRHSELVASDGTPDPALSVDSDGKVGIGTDSPDSELHVEGDIKLSTTAPFIFYKSTNDSSGLRFKTVGTATNAVRFQESGGTDILDLRENGEIYMGYVYSDTVGGTRRDLYIDNTGKLGYVASQRALKDNIKPLTSTNWIYDLEPVSFTWKADGRNDIGLIVEDVAEVENIPQDFISYQRTETKHYFDNDKNEITEEAYNAFKNKETIHIETEYMESDAPETVNYYKLVIPLLVEIQNLKKRIEKLDVNRDIGLEAGSGDYYSNDASQGWTGSFTNGDGDTVTVKNGIITDVS